MPSLTRAISVLHDRYAIPHIIITSVSLPDATTVSSTMPNSVPGSSAPTPTPQEEGQGQSQPPRTKTLSVVGSTMTSARQPRAFQISFPAIDCYFSGTGDMLAALLVARLRQAAKDADLLGEASWRSPDDVAGPDLPLAKATEMALASMHAVLKDTAEHYGAATVALRTAQEHELNEVLGEEANKDKEMQSHLKLTRAAEVRVVRNVEALRDPQNLQDFRAQLVVASVES